MQPKRNQRGYQVRKDGLSGGETGKKNSGGLASVFPQGRMLAHRCQGGSMKVGKDRPLPYGRSGATVKNTARRNGISVEWIIGSVIRRGQDEATQSGKTGSGSSYK
jgi:hypothetical protein